MKHSAICLSIALVLFTSLAVQTPTTWGATLLAPTDSTDRAGETPATTCGGDFTLASSDPTDVHISDAAWGDYDNDGDLDILLAGVAGIVGPDTSEVWRNDGGGTFTMTVSSLSAIHGGSVAWGDYDDDGDLDILLAGHGAYGLTAEVWRNNGNDTFTQASTAPTAVAQGDVAWGDYDDDGDLDILLSGHTGSYLTAEVWRNEDGMAFTQVITTLTGIYDSSVAWGDYDDDGDLDILMAGSTGPDRVTEIWRNEDGVTFTQAITNITGISYASVAWGDYDNDGDLDILLSGSAGIDRVTEVWRNDGSETFALASADPTGVIWGNTTWGDYDNDGDLDILLAGGSASGETTEVWRNDGNDTFTQASTAPPGIYQGSAAWGDYDNDGDLDILITGDTATGRVTEVWNNPRCPHPRVFTQASTTPTGINNGDVAWGDYDDDGDLDILLTGYGDFGRVTEVWRNEDGLAFTQAITNITGVDSGSVAWGDYDDDGDLDILLTGEASGEVFTTEVWRNEDGVDFTQAITNITDVYLSDAIWGDYDNDGDLDILLAGDSSSGRVTEIWQNDNGITFTQAITNVTGVNYASVAWGDYDDDGDLDILLAGSSGSGYTTEVWRNEGGVAFTQAITTPTGIYYGGVTWGDYDNDSDLDILLSGWTKSGGPSVTEVWRNEGGLAFTQAITNVTDVYVSDAAWGDYDNDGDLDILLAGNSGSGRVTEVWHNEGNNSFALSSSAPTDISYASVAWGDYDHDGDLDILLAGSSGSGRVTEIWRSEPLETYLPLVLGDQ